jgi:DNA-directed RNA polymerase specialized sigma24 family protein
MQEWLAQKFEENRPHLRAVAYRMLGSLAEADDAVQPGCGSIVLMPKMLETLVVG